MSRRKNKGRTERKDIGLKNAIGQKYKDTLKKGNRTKNEDKIEKRK